MISLLVSIILGLSIWMILPKLIYNKPKYYKKDTPYFFVSLLCKVAGILIIIVSIINYLFILI